MDAALRVLSGRDRWCVIQGDNSEVLRALPRGSVSHVITDPPYSPRTHVGALSMRDGGSDIPIDFEPFGAAEVESFVGITLRLVRRWCIAFCALEHLGTYAEAAGEAWIRAGIWDRPDGTPQISGDRPGQAAEGIAIWHRAGRKRWNAGGARGMWRSGVERGERVHPTQKPLRLMLELVELFTDPGDVILDPYAGSGTTAVAALRLGRRCICVEKDPAYAEAAAKRIAEDARLLAG